MSRTSLAYNSNGESRGTSPRHGSQGLSLGEAAALVAIGFALVLAALNPSGSSSVVDVVPIRVEAGDTLWQLAERYPVPGLSTEQTVELIAQKNELTSGSVKAGATLLVPSLFDETRMAMR